MFPFDRPAAPEEDGNQSLAVNTTDGSVVYDVAFALVWADDGEDVTTRNEAYAFASCADCAAVAVGFQVVLIVGQTDVIVPENLSAAANYNCVRCLTYALASQLVLTLDGPLSADGMTRLNALWQQIAEYGRNLQNVPLSEIQGRLDAFKRRSWRSSGATPAPRRAVPPARPPPRRAAPRREPARRRPGPPRAPRTLRRSPARRRPSATGATARPLRPRHRSPRVRRHGHRTGSGHAVAGTHGHGPAGAVGRGARAGDAPAQLLGAGPRVRPQNRVIPWVRGGAAGGNWAGASHAVGPVTPLER